MKHGRLTGVIAVLLIWAFRPTTADACKCMTGSDACRSIAEADAIFEATVASIETRSHSISNTTLMRHERVVHLRDVRAWRGRAADVVVTGMGGDDCGYDFQVGVRYVIVGNRSVEDGLVRTGTCSMTRPRAQAGAMRDYVESLSSPSLGGRLWGTVFTQKPWAPGEGVPREPKPVADVRVNVAGAVERSMITGLDGQFSFDALPPGDYRVSAELDGRKIDFKAPNLTTLDGPHACAVMDILAPSATFIAGVVMYEDGTAAAGVPVELVAADGSPLASFLGVGGKTDESGEYSIPNVPPGRYLLGVGAIGGPSRDEPFALMYGRSDSGEVILNVSEEDEAIMVSPIVTRRLGPARIEGVVTWPDQTPARGLIVTAAALGERGPVRGLVRVESAPDGRFTLDVFADTPYHVTFSHGQRVVYIVEIAATGEPLLVTLPKELPR